MSSVQPGCLWVVATPIGHRDDLSARAIETLRAVAVIAAEDTRHSRPLLIHHHIDTPLIALHEHNERDAVDAAIAALSVAGLPSDRFVFEGFLPPKAAARRNRLEELAGDARTLIFYESSHRVAESLADMRDVFGAAREAVLARELTKMFETVLGEPLAELAARVAADPDQQRGECVILVAGRGEEADAKLAEGQRIFAILREELPPAKAAKMAAAITGAPRKLLYEG
jgi:16S rRNA (cytidine1402-2'-O)-methyltransferase